VKVSDCTFDGINDTGTAFEAIYMVGNVQDCDVKCTIRNPVSSILRFSPQTYANDSITRIPKRNRVTVNALEAIATSSENVADITGGEENAVTIDAICASAGHGIVITGGSYLNVEGSRIRSVPATKYGIYENGGDNTTLRHNRVTGAGIAVNWLNTSATTGDEFMNRWEATTVRAGTNPATFENKGDYELIFRYVVLGKTTANMSLGAYAAGGTCELGATAVNTGNTRYRQNFDLRRVDQIRVLSGVTVASSSPNTPVAFPIYIDGTTFVTIGTGAGSESVALGATNNVLKTDWIDVPAAARIDDVLLNVGLSGGDGSGNPSVTHFTIEGRRKI
jgi:hypothetical protein